MNPVKALDIVALGEAMVEFNQTSNQSADEPPSYLQGFGGDTRLPRGLRYLF